MTNFYLVGDTHGDLSFASRIMKAAKADGIDTIFQLGDFGVWPGKDGAYYLDTLSQTAVNRGIRWNVTLGNHEDYDQIESHPAYAEKGFFIRPNIWIMGNHVGVMEYAGLKIAAFGGAYSIDKNYRKPNQSWWWQEKPRPADLEMLTNLMMREGWSSVDVLLTHDAPNSMPTWDGFFKDDQESNFCRQMVTLAYDIAKPAIGFHGHYHRAMNYTHRHDGGHAVVVGLGANPFAMSQWLDENDHGSVAVATVTDGVGSMVVKTTNEWVRF